MPYIGKQPADIIATAIDTTTGDFSGNVTAGGTLGVTGETTLATHLNMGDGDIIKLGASADLQIQHDGNDSKITDGGTGNLVLDSDGTEVRIMNGSEFMGRFQNNDAVKLFFDNSKKFETTSGGVTVTGDITNTSGDLTLDVAGNIILDADGGVVRVFDGGTQIGNFANNSSDFHINVSTQDKDFAINGNDGGSTFTALTLDMSEGGKAIFNSGLAIGGTGDANTLDDYEEGSYDVTASTSTGSITLNSSFKSASYTKVGRLVHVNGLINVASVSSPTGVVTISLPFTPVDLSQRRGDSTTSLYITGVVSNNVSDFVTSINEGFAGFFIQLGDTNSPVNDAGEQIQAGVNFVFSASYHTA